MARFLNAIAGVSSRRMEEHSIRKAVQELRSYSDHELDDLGLSRAEILDAVTGAREERAKALTPLADYSKAIKELESYSDEELEDLNLSRSEIPFAVIYGKTETKH